MSKRNKEKEPEIVANNTTKAADEMNTRLMEIKFHNVPLGVMVKVRKVYQYSYWMEYPQLILGVIGTKTEGPRGNGITIPGGIELPQTASSLLKANVREGIAYLNQNTILAKRERSPQVLI